MKKLSIHSAVLSAFLMFSAVAHAEDYVVTLKDDQFSPAELIVPVHQKIKLTIKNLNSTPVEFESSDFNREKVVGANSEASVILGPLDAGRYKYFNDFHRETTGVIVAK